MKLVQCKITLHSAEDYERVVIALLHKYLAHTAVYAPRNTFVVTVLCNHVMEERNLDALLVDLNLQCEKKVLSILPRSKPVSSSNPEIQGPPAIQDVGDKQFLISPSIVGRAA